MTERKARRELLNDISWIIAKYLSDAELEPFTVRIREGLAIFFRTETLVDMRNLIIAALQHTSLKALRRSAILQDIMTKIDNYDPSGGANVEDSPN